MQNFTTINPYTLEEDSLPFEQAADINIKLVELEKQFKLWRKKFSNRKRQLVIITR